MVQKHDPHVSHSNAVLHHCATSVSCGPAGKTVSSCISPNKTWQESVVTKGSWWRETLSTLPLLHPLLSAASRNLNATNSRYDRGRAEVQRLWGAWRGLAAGTWKLSSSILKAADKKNTTHTLSNLQSFLIAWKFLVCKIEFQMYFPRCRWEGRDCTKHDMKRSWDGCC